MQIAELMLRNLNYDFDSSAKAAFTQYVALRRQQPHLANARSIRNSMRLRHATRVVATHSAPTRVQLRTLQAEDILASRVFGSADSVKGD